MRLLGGAADSTTSTARAANAAPPIGAIATTLAPATARDRVLRVSPTGLVERVYNLTVADQPEYFAGGLLAHNCDCALYGYRDLIIRRVDFDKPPMTEEEKLKREERRLLDSIRREPEPEDVYGFEEVY